jgi:hypothetical protein
MSSAISGETSSVWVEETGCGWIEEGGDPAFLTDLLVFLGILFPGRSGLDGSAIGSMISFSYR